MTWQPIETALDDKQVLAGKPVLVVHDHESDVYWIDEKSGRCTPYAAWAEGNGHESRPGVYIAVWGGGYEEDESGEGWGPVTKMPDWWFKHDSEFEQPLAPTYWQHRPEPPE